jgi:multisubunit Na+/H+ antiporter MnhB subunit
MADPRARLTIVLSVAMVLLGVALIVRTLTAGGGGLAVGLLLGILFIVAGCGRSYLQLASQRTSR